MPATQVTPVPASGSAATFGDLTIGELLDLMLEAQGTRLERQLLAATLRALASWLGDQSQLLLEDEVGGRPLRAVPTVEVKRVSALTTREREVARCVARGLSNRQIAEELVISVTTAERHVANILSKLHMRSRVQIATWAAAREAYCPGH